MRDEVVRGKGDGQEVDEVGVRRRAWGWVGYGCLLERLWAKEGGMGREILTADLAHIISEAFTTAWVPRCNIEISNLKAGLA